MYAEQFSHAGQYVKVCVVPQLLTKLPNQPTTTNSVVSVHVLCDEGFPHALQLAGGATLLRRMLATSVAKATKSYAHVQIR